VPVTSPGRVLVLAAEGRQHQNVGFFCSGRGRMQTLQELQRAVSQLSPEELASFRRWFEEFDARLWDSQFEEDVQEGRLDRIAEQAIADFYAGKCKEL
jgi:hypothetical protein